LALDEILAHSYIPIAGTGTGPGTGPGTGTGTGPGPLTVEPSKFSILSDVASSAKTTEEETKEEGEKREIKITM
jgi:hypothetical protein